jgi:cation transport regulator ChaB
VSALIEPSRRYDEESRRRGDVTRRTAAHTAARTCVDGAIGARTAKSATLGRPTTWSPLGARSASPGSALIEPSRRCDEESRRRDDATRRTAAHTAARTCVDGTTGTHTTRPATLGQRDDSLAARLSLGVAGVGSDRAEPAMRRGEREAR